MLYKESPFNVIIDSVLWKLQQYCPFFLNESTEAWAVLMATSFLATIKTLPKAIF
jgi:hypothetical protein